TPSVLRIVAQRLATLRDRASPWETPEPIRILPPARDPLAGPRRPWPKGVARRIGASEIRRVTTGFGGPAADTRPSPQASSVGERRAATCGAQFCDMQTSQTSWVGARLADTS